MIKRLQHILVLEPGHLKSLMQLAHVCLTTQNKHALPVFIQAVNRLQEATPILIEVLHILQGDKASLSEQDISSFYKETEHLNNDELIYCLYYLSQKQPVANIYTVSRGRVVEMSAFLIQRCERPSSQINQVDDII